MAQARSYTRSDIAVVQAIAVLWERACPRCRRHLAGPYRWQANHRTQSGNTSSSRLYMARNARAEVRGSYWVLPGTLACGSVNECTAPP